MTPEDIKKCREVIVSMKKAYEGMAPNTATYDNELDALSTAIKVIEKYEKIVEVTNK